MPIAAVTPEVAAAFWRDGVAVLRTEDHLQAVARGSCVERFHWVERVADRRRRCVVDLR